MASLWDLMTKSKAERMAGYASEGSTPRKKKKVAKKGGSTQMKVAPYKRGGGGLGGAIKGVQSRHKYLKDL